MLRETKTSPTTDDDASPSPPLESGLGKNVARTGQGHSLNHVAGVLAPHSHGFKVCSFPSIVKR